MKEDEQVNIDRKVSEHSLLGDDKMKGLDAVLQEYDVFEDQLKKRRELITKIESYSKTERAGLITYISTESEYASIDSDDIPAFGNALLSLGDLDILYLIIESPGGDGTIAEKIINLCRSYCNVFKVIIPNRAKSAATIIALGADEIIMGYCSEIGPIDAQIPIFMDGIPHYISAQSFIDAKSELERQFKECLINKDDPRAILQQIATLNPAFIQHCIKLMEFGRDVAENCLKQYMFKNDNKKTRNKKIKIILKQLSSVESFKVHGRMIDGNIAKTKLNLNVRLLAKDDQLWKDIWNYYMRAYVILSGKLGKPSSKLVETRNTILLKGSR